MKPIFFILLLTFTSFKCYSEVFISGEIKNAPPTSEVKVTYYNNSFEWIEVIAANSKLDEKGRFNLKFILDKSTNAKLTIGAEQTFIFLVPNDSLHITNDYTKFDETIVYSGKGSEDNNYIVADFIAGFNTKSNMYSVFNDADKYKLYEDSLEKANLDFLKTYDNANFTPEFRKEITISTKYRFINPRWMYKIDYDTVNKKFIDKPTPQNYFDFLKSIDLNDQIAFDNGNYSNALGRYINENYDGNKRLNIPDSLPKIKKTGIHMQDEYNYRKSKFKDKILDYQLTSYLKNYIKYVIADSIFVKNLFDDYKNTCKNTEYISIIEKMINNAYKLSKGNDAPELNLLNKDGKQVTLSSLKGKTVYIDFWATWCVPCIASMAHYDKLTEKFKDRNDILFLFVNVKDNYEKWKNYSEKVKILGLNLYANNEESVKIYKLYNFDSIPHYALIDKNGKLINANAERPESIESILEAIK